LLLVNMGCLEDSFIYFPAKYPEGYWHVGKQLPVEDCYFNTEDGLRLHGWFAASSGAQTTLLWLHGNAGNITHRQDNLMRLLRLGVNIFIIDYRGYGRSQGHPSESGLYKDAQAAYDYLVQTKHVAPQQIYIFGRSLGGAVAINLAQANKCAGIIVESTFTSLPVIGRELYPFLPVNLLTRERYDSLAKIAQVKAPILIIHGDADEIVSFEHGRRLFLAANEPKEFYPIKGAGHNNTYIVGGRAYFDKIRAFVNQIR
jgi:hypothetical protein